MGDNHGSIAINPADLVIVDERPSSVLLYEALGDEWVSQGELSARLGLHMNTVQRRLKQMTNEGSVERATAKVGTTRVAVYRRTKGAGDGESTETGRT